MKKITVAKTIYEILEKEYPESSCALWYKKPWQLLLAVMFSAQNLDSTVNIVTKKLFKKFSTISSLLNAKHEEVIAITKSLNFWQNKTKYAMATLKILKENYKGDIPYSIEELVKLPGIGRKSANVVLNELKDKHEGIVVDTHVSRLSHRLGLTDHEKPDKIEMDLLPFYKNEERKNIAHLLITHGRNICKARNPQCSKCVLNKICPSAEKFQK